MFGRWVQENFYRYLRQEYAFDKIIQYAVDELDKSVMVVNREYSNIQYKIKKQREKLARAKANLYELQRCDPNEKEDKKQGKWFGKTLELSEKIQQIEQEINRLIDERKTIKYKIPVGEMPQGTRYTKLHQESKYLMNIIKMICYRAETGLANKLAPHFSRADEEVSTLVKAITKLSVYIIPDQDNALLNIMLYPLANQRSRLALSKVIEEINATKTVYPGTNMIMKFKITTLTVAPSQEF
jgi:septal ring factor EnvC (AmiA/AmiB activator)